MSRGVDKALGYLRSLIEIHSGSTRLAGDNTESSEHWAAASDNTAAPVGPHASATAASPESVVREDAIVRTLASEAARVHRNRDGSQHYSVVVA